MDKSTSYKTTIDIINLLLKNNNAFACYKTPGEQAVNFIIIKNTNNKISITDEDKSNNKLAGFLFHPFNNKNESRTYLFKPFFTFTNNDVPNDIESISISAEYNLKGLPNLNENFSDLNKEEYSELISNTIEELKARKLKKVVVSRQIYKEEINIKKSGTYFTDLINKYKSAFVYLLHIPGEMAWIGASPETFLRGNTRNYETVALAGTIQNTGQNKVDWGEKEIYEQKIVSDYIESVFEKLNITNLIKTGPETISTGNLFHLQTKYNFTSLDENKINLIKLLHPTPAVCGMPKQEAIELIESIEDNDRQYYSGLVGNIGDKTNTELFVNLRCLQFLSRGGIIYSGGGITIDSEPDKEWEETCYKAETLLSVLEKI